MAGIDKIIKENPKAVEELGKMKDVIEALHEMRRSGIAKGSDIRPFRGRQTLSELRPGASRRGGFKLTLGA